MPATSDVKISRPRDGRLDVLRGLCLLGMVLAHFIEQGLVVPWVVHETAVHWLRFAAGGFVLTSGLCIGVIHYQRALDPARRWPTYLSLFKRAGLVLLVHYFATLLSLLVIPMNGWPMPDVPTMLRDVLFFYTGYDLLLFYVFMLAASPVVIEVVRRVGVLPMLAISLVVFFVKYHNPYLLLWSIEHDFPLLRWQLVFVVGLLLGTQAKQFDAMSVKAKWRLFAGTMSVGLAIATASTVERVTGHAFSSYLTVQKMPLTITEAIRYIALAIALAVLVDRVWPTLAGTRTQRVLATLGVQSLMLWVVHVPVVAMLVRTEWLIALLSAGLALWAVAGLALWLSRQWSAWLTRLPKLGFAVPAFGSLALCGVLLHFQNPPGLVESPGLQLANHGEWDEEPLWMDDESSFFLDDDETPTPIPLEDDSISEMV